MESVSVIVVKTTALK